MDQVGYAGQNSKRLRMQEGPLWLGPHMPTLSDEVRSKCMKPTQDAFLLVRIIKAVDVDREFRVVTNDRFYGVVCWINPDDEYRTRPIAPNVFNYNLDPVWEEQVIVPLLETRVDKAVLHLEVLRGSRIVVDPGCSNGRKLVGRAEFQLVQLEKWGIAKVKLELLEPVGFGWKPEGYILLEMQLLVFPAATKELAEEAYDSEAEELSYSE